MSGEYKITIGKKKMTDKKLTYGLIGLVAGVILTVIIGLSVNKMILIISPILASLGAGIGSMKDSENNKPKAGFCFVIGLVAALVTLLIGYYVIPTEISGGGYLGYLLPSTVTTLSQVIPLTTYLSQTINIFFLLEVFIGASIGFALSKVVGKV